jgi:putative RNA 2'-phosphotransferase
VDAKRLVKVSKYLSRHLRHDPARLGLTLDHGGWVEVDALLAACAARSFSLTPEELREVVDLNDKQRFSFDATGTRIRANQGHSVDVDLGLEPTVPPRILFHGTSQSALTSIMRSGLQRQRRHHVHLSEGAATALRVGRRHGPPIVLEVAAERMYAEGHLFFVTDNRVWLTAEVPPRYLRARPDESA